MTLGTQFAQEGRLYGNQTATIEQSWRYIRSPEPLAMCNGTEESAWQ
jgi:hypothetical protein